MTTAGIEARLSQRALTRAAVEEFVYEEAALLDAWNIDAWLALFHPDCQYEVTPTNQDDPTSLSPNSVLFLIGDDYERLSQRVIRMNKKTAHVEFPRSKTRHIYSNVRIIKDTGAIVKASVNFVTFRTKSQITTHYPGSFEITLQRDDAGFLILRKRVSLDLEALVPQGKVSIFL